MPHFRPDPLERRNALRGALLGAGLTEVVTPALVPDTQAARLGWPIDAADGAPGADAVAGDPIRVRNPLSERHAVLRSGLVGSLLDVLALNERHGRRDVAIFEVGKGYARGADGSPAEWWRLGFLLAGDAVPPTWSIASRPWDVEDAKAIAALVARTAGVPEPTFRAHAGGAPLHPGRAALVSTQGRLAGLVGEVHADSLEAWDLRSEHVIVGELAVEGLAGGQLAPARVLPVGRQPVTERDLAVVVEDDVPAGEVAATLRAAAGDEVALDRALRCLPRRPADRHREEPGVAAAGRERRARPRRGRGGRARRSARAGRRGRPRRSPARLIGPRGATTRHSRLRRW